VCFIQDNRAALARNGKLEIPVLAVHGAISNTGPRMKDMMREVANHVTTLYVADTGHWVAEENPDGFVKGLLAFLLAKELP
jgi:pimeloyl-ACP methyl ester carboxylesterase